MRNKINNNKKKTNKTNKQKQKQKKQIKAKNTPKTLQKHTAISEQF